MARPLKAKLIARTTAVVLAAAVATLGLGTAAQAATGATAADRPSVQASDIGIQAANSPWPGLGWYYQTSFTSRSTCDYYGFLYVLYGYATGSTCALRYDRTGYDLWLRA